MIAMRAAGRRSKTMDNHGHLGLKLGDLKCVAMSYTKGYEVLIYPDTMEFGVPNFDTHCRETR